jgi:cytochrome c oxidase assembly protein subunit 15
LVSSGTDAGPAPAPSAESAARPTLSPGTATGTIPGPGFRRLVYLAIALTFALVLVGGIVRISDSGLGCGPAGSGAEGWPLCGGRLVPLVDTNMIVEYAHRVLAGLVAVVIAALALLARRRYPQQRGLGRVCLAAFGLVMFQAALGGLTVEKGLKQELVAAHLGIAMLQLGLLMLVARLARPSGQGSGSPASPPRATRAVRLLAVAASVAVLATIVAGGYMSASQLRGTGEVGPDVHTACGTEFPACGGEFLPFGRSRAVDIHLTHRAFMYVASILVLSLFLAALWQRRRGERRAGGRNLPFEQDLALGARLARAAGVSVAILLLQVLLGAINVWAGEHAWLVVAHLVGGTLLWSSLVQVSLLALEAPHPAMAPRRGEAKVEAVPA